MRGGVLEAIQEKLHGIARDPNFLRDLIYSGSLDVCIDGLNEVNSDTRANITQFVEMCFKGNVIMTTQPLEWTPPSTAKLFVLKPLDEKKITKFLVKQLHTLKNESSLNEDELYAICEKYLSKMIPTEDTEKNTESTYSKRMILSNPMDLSIVAQMLSKGFEPDLFRLQEQYFEMMRKDYERIHITKKFPIKEFSEHVYLMKLGDKRELFKKDFQHELIMMEKYKMVIKRQIINSKEDNEEIWYFRHDKMMDYFVVHVFLSDEKLLSQHLDDPRMRGVYFMLADLLPYDTAMDLREILIQYAATTKDHTISDKFIQHLHARKHAI